jgi:hypothetical protein
MKTKLISFLMVLFIGLWSYSQKLENDKLILIRTTSKSAYPYSYENGNWNNKFSPNNNLLGYELIDMYIDTAQTNSIIRSVISPKYYNHLNKKSWWVVTKLTGQGQIVSVAFWFQDESGVNNQEFAILAERIKKEVKWKLTLDKEVKDLFYLELSIPGPKL